MAHSLSLHWTLIEQPCFFFPLNFRHLVYLFHVVLLNFTVLTICYYSKTITVYLIMTIFVVFHFILTVVVVTCSAEYSLGILLIESEFHPLND